MSQDCDMCQDYDMSQECDICQECEMCQECTVDQLTGAYGGQTFSGRYLTIGDRLLLAGK